MKPSLRIAEGYLYLELDGRERAFIKFSADNGKLYILSTFVPESHRGRGLAGRLVEELLSFSERNGLSVVPLCSYAVSYFIKNRERRALLAEPYRSMSDEELLRYYEERVREESRRRQLRLEEPGRRESLDCPVCG
ncbi:MAG: GNAT family N-acetyltransferase [Acidilobaceae archaeon]